MTKAAVKVKSNIVLSKKGDILCKYTIMLEENMIKLAKLGAMIGLANLGVERLPELNI